jgi:hypothetical protein
MCPDRAHPALHQLLGLAINGGDSLGGMMVFLCGFEAAYAHILHRRIKGYRKGVECRGVLKECDCVFACSCVVSSLSNSLTPPLVCSGGPPCAPWIYMNLIWPRAPDSIQIMRIRDSISSSMPCRDVCL